MKGKKKTQTKNWKENIYLWVLWKIPSNYIKVSVFCAIDSWDSFNCDGSYSFSFSLPFCHLSSSQRVSGPVKFWLSCYDLLLNAS